MRLPLRARRALTPFLVCTALLLAATATAWAEDEDPDTHETKTATVVVTSDGTKTVRLIQGEDGEFILEPEQAEGSGARMHVVVRKDSNDGDVQVLELKDGKWVVSEHPIHVEHEVTVSRTPAVTTMPGHAPEGRNPMATVMRWLMTDGMAGELPSDPMKAWFEGGADVPMAGLRDALKADGWTSNSLQAWFVQHLVGGLARLHAPAAQPPRAMHGPMRGHWFGIGRGRGCDCGARSPGHRGHGRQARHGRCHGGGDCRNTRSSCGSCRGDCGSCNQRRSCGSCKGSCGSCDQRGSCSSCRGSCGSCNQRGSCGKGQGSCGNCDGGCGQQRRGPARRQAFMLWNDGSGWRHRRVDSQGPVAHGGHDHDAPADMVFHGSGSDEAPELMRFVRELIGETDSAPDSTRIMIEGLDLLPPELLEQVPPGVLEGVLKELQGLGLGDLLAPTTRDCGDCPKRGACQGGDCGKAAGAESGSCCGTCKGEGAK